MTTYRSTHTRSSISTTDGSLVFLRPATVWRDEIVARARLAKTKDSANSRLSLCPMILVPLYLREIIARSRRSLKTLLLDQTKSARPRQHLRRRSFVSRAYHPFKIAVQLSAHDRAFASGNSRGLNAAITDSSTHASAWNIRMAFLTARLSKGSGKSTNVKASRASNAARRYDASCRRPVDLTGAPRCQRR